MFRSLDELLPNSLRKAGAERQVKAAMVIAAAEAALADQFGAELSGYMRPTTFRNGAVTVRCTRAAYAQEIALHEVDILARLAERLGQGIVSRLRPVS